MNEPERILLLNISGIGDFVDSTPALRLARELRPDSILTLVVSEKVYAVAQNCPYMTDVIPLPTAQGKGTPRLADSLRWLRQVWPLRGRFDLVLNLYTTASTRGKQFIEFMSRWSGARSVGIPDAPQYTDGAVRALSTVGLLNPSKAVPPPGDFEIWLSAEETRRARELTEHISEDMIAVFLGGERRTRHESSERAALWLSDIQRCWNVHPVIIGTLHDPGLPANTVVRFTDLRGKCTLGETAAVISKSKAVITTHSAPQHFASIWQIPTVVLVGPGDIERYHPHLPPDKMELLRNPVECSPCYYETCPKSGSDYQKCMTGIAVQQVIEAFNRIYPLALARLS